MTDEYEYFFNKLPKRIYFSKSFPQFGDQNVKLRYVSKVFDSEELHEFINVKDEIVIRTTHNDRQEIKALFYEDSRELISLTFQRFSGKTGKPYKDTHFTFHKDEIVKIYELLRFIKQIHIDGGEKIKLDDDILGDLLVSEDDKRKFMIDNLDLMKGIVENNLSYSDVEALGYKKKQLGIFEQLLVDADYFETKRQEWGIRGKEGVWQRFFEQNSWIFGYGLNYIFTSQLTNDQKLEQVVAGYDFTQSGKRVDALMKTKGLISSLCFVEIKTHETDLLMIQSEPYRPDCWQISKELAGSVAQIQKTVQKALKNIQTKIEFRNQRGEPIGESAFLYQPKSFVVVGSLNEFISHYGVNEEKYSSFELFRRNITNPEIITFDELYERAKYIVQHIEREETKQSQDFDEIVEIEDIPF